MVILVLSRVLSRSLKDALLDDEVEYIACVRCLVFCFGHANPYVVFGVSLCTPARKRSGRAFFCLRCTCTPRNASEPWSVTEVVIERNYSSRLTLSVETLVVASTSGVP